MAERLEGRKVYHRAGAGLDSEPLFDLISRTWRVLARALRQPQITLKEIDP